MKSSKPRITHTQVQKSGGYIEKLHPVNHVVNKIVNTLAIEYEEVKGENKPSTPPRLKINFKCDIHSNHNSKGFDAKKDGEIKAVVEIGMTVTLDHYSHEYLDYVMQSVWPYLRSAAQLQLQIIGLSQNADRLPYQIADEEPPQNS